MVRGEEEEEEQANTTVVISVEGTQDLSFHKHTAENDASQRRDVVVVGRTVLLSSWLTGLLNTHTHIQTPARVLLFVPLK